MTRHNRTYILLYTLLMLCGCLSASAAEAWTQDGLFDNADLRDSIAQLDVDHHRPIYFDQEDLKDLDKTREDIQGGYIDYFYLHNRRALTGETCNINKMINSVGAGSWNKDLGNVLNEDLNDYAEINAVASVGATVDPVISVRDRSAYYAKGTTAGFCLVSGSEGSALSLNLLNAMAVGFYRDGQLVGVVGTSEGQTAGLLGVTLITVPGSEEATINITATAPGVFDEVTLDFSGAANVSVGQMLKIKYAFVGRAKEFTVTEYDYHDNQYGILPDSNGRFPSPGDTQLTPAFHENYPENSDVVLDYVKGWNPVLLGLPFPILASEMENFTDKPGQDEDADNFVTLTPIAAVGYQGGAKFMLKHSTPGEEHTEVFEAGTEVGFKYKYLSVLNLGLGTWIDVVLFDRNGNKVQTETIKANGLSLSLANGGSQITTLVANVPFSGAEIRFMTGVSVDVGGIALYHAFVRQQPDTRHHCPINPSPDTNLCPSQATFQLRSNPAVSVTWTVVDKPAGSPVTVTEGGFVSGMDVEFEDEQNWYTFRATAADGCYDEVTLFHLPDDDPDNFNNECGVPIVNPRQPEGVAYNPELEEYAVITEETYPGFTGGLLHFDELRNPENVLTTDINDFATYVGGLELGTNIPVIGVHKKQGNILDYTDESVTKKRLGFVVASSVEGLNLNALQLWQVRCYKNGEEVYRSVVDESNVVSADLGGSNRGQKMRYSIGVPRPEMGGPSEVDAIILWSSGLLAVDAGEIDIYYPFWEEDLDEGGCNDPMGCNAELLSTRDHHTTLDFDLMTTGSAVVVANAVNDLDNFIDNDRDSFMSVANSVSLGSGIPIAVNMGRTIDYHHQLGIMMDNKTYLAGVNAGTWLTIETYYRGVPTGDKFDDWNVVDANVVGYGDRNVLIVQPKYIYDEVKMTIGKVLGALDIMKFYGIFLRGDIDNDGIPDCQDPESCTTKLTPLGATKVCVGDFIDFTAKGNNDTPYWVRFSEPVLDADGSRSQREATREMANEYGDVKVSYETMIPGAYQVVYYENQVVTEYLKDEETGKYLYDEVGNPLTKTYDAPGKTIAAEAYYVHPDYTTWLTTASNTDWTKWDNWSNGSPYCCTKVVIPSDALNYPQLDGEVVDGDEYCCDVIHFEPRAEIGSVHKLNYTKAWTEVDLMPNRYHLLSAPLKKMYTGDMFVADRALRPVMPAYFTPLNSSSLPENRFNPTIYQRMWNASVLEHGWSADPAAELPGKEEIKEMALTDWSRKFNHVATEYGMGKGFSIWVDNGILPEDEEVRFRFPKEHGSYTYFSDFDQTSTGITETVDRGGSEETEGGSTVEGPLGRFIYEDKQTQKVIAFDRTATGKENREYHRTVYTGALPLEVNLSNNSASTHFLFGNPLMSPVNVREFLRGNKDVVTGVMVYDGNTVKTIKYDVASDTFAGTADLDFISPMQGVLLIAPVADTSLSLTLTELMLSGRGMAAAADGEEADAPSALRIKAADGNCEAAMLMLVGDKVEMRNAALFDNEVRPALALFAIDEGMPCDMVEAYDNLPLTIIKHPGLAVTLDFQAYGEVSLDDYELIDRATAESYPIDKAVELPADMAASCGRFVIRRTARVEAPDGGGDDSMVYLEMRADGIHIYSPLALISEVIVSSADGRRTFGANPDAVEAWVPSQSGVFIVTVVTADGERKSFKLYSRS